MSEKFRKFPVRTYEEYVIDEQELQENPECRTPVILCVDCSYTMMSRLTSVRRGLENFCREMEEDPVAGSSVELCIVNCGGDESWVEVDFTPPGSFTIPELKAAGGTPLGDGVETALYNLERRRGDYQRNGVNNYRPWLIIIGDSGRTDPVDRAAARLREEQAAGRLNVICILADDPRTPEEREKARDSSLMALAPDGRLHCLRDMNFKELFGWLSRSIRSISNSISGEEASMAPTSSWDQSIKRSDTYTG